MPLILGPLLLLTIPLSIISSAGIFVFPVQSEQVVVGSTTGIGGSQTDDGVREGLFEIDTAPDLSTAPSSQILMTGSTVGGAFPADIASEDGSFIQYREALLASTDHYPTTQTLTTGSSCGGSFPASILSSDDAYLCVRESPTAIAFDSASSTASNSATSTYTWSHTTAGVNRLLVVGATIRQDAGQTIGSVTYAGAPLTFVRADAVAGSVRTELWYRANPALGTNTVLITLSGAAKAAVGAISLTGVDQTAPLDANNGAVGSSATGSASVTTIADHAWLIDVIGFRSTGNGLPTGAPGSGQTQRWSAYTETGASSGNIRGKASTGGPTSPPGAVAMTWSLSAAVDWAVSAVSIKPAEETYVAYRATTGSGTVNSPKTRISDGSVWGVETEESTSGSPLRAVRIASSPTTPGHRIIVTQSDDGWLDAYVCTPTCTVTNDIGQVWTTAPGSPEKRFDVAYESASGEAILVYGVASADPTRDLAYRTFAGGAWSAEQYLDDTGHGTNVQYTSINLASRAGTDLIGLVGGDGTNDDVNAWIWDGDAFGSFAEITAGAEAPDQEKIAIAWESSSGDLLVVTIPSGSVNIVYREFTTSWGAASTFRCANDNSEFISLKSNPLATANDMILATNDDIGGDLDLHTCYWTGNGWANWITHDVQIDSTTTRPFDFAWEASGGRGLLVWGTSPGQVEYRTFVAPNTWGAIANVSMGANTHGWVQMRTNPKPGAGTTRIMGAVLEDGANDLGAIRWDGTTLTVIGASTFTSDVGTSAYESFELEYGQATGGQVHFRHDWSGIASGADSEDLCVEAHAANAGGESMLLQVLTPPATWNTRITVTKAADDDADQCYTLTAAEFNAGSPSVRWIGSSESLDGTQSDVVIDHERIVRRFTTYRLEIQYAWTGVPSGDLYRIDVKGYRGDEDISVQVLTPPATWTTRITITSVVNQISNYTLSVAEYNGGSPQVRYIDAGSADPAPSDLFLDWVSIASVRLQHSLDVRQNATGVLAGSNPILVAKGNITAGGENFHVQAWNFTTAAWQLMGAAPFTPANVYHNYSLAPDHISAGIVRVRFVDAASQDAVPGALSMDFVAVLITNEAPTLSNAGASPTVGNITTTFSFFVRYVDPENNAPSIVNLTLGGSAFGMAENNSADLTYADGKDYFLDRTISVRGTFDYWFSTRASGGDMGLVSTPVQQVVVSNRPPVITNAISLDGVHSGRPYVRDFNETDPDGDIPTWSMTTNASWLAIGPSNGTVWGQAPPAVSSSSVNITVMDGFGGLAWNSYTLFVGNVAPTVTNPVTSLVTPRNAAFVRDFNGTDPDGDALAWSLRSNATFLGIDPSLGTVSGTTTGGPAAYWVEVTAFDGFGGTDRVNFTIMLVNAVPQITVSAGLTAVAGQSYEAVFSGTDPDGDALAWSIATNASWVVLDALGGVFGGIASEGAFFVNLTVRDPYGGLAYRNVTIVVGAPSAGPESAFTRILPPVAIGLAIVALAVVLLAKSRRRSIIDQALLLNGDGSVRFEYAAVTPAPLDGARVRAILDQYGWEGVSQADIRPYVLHSTELAAGRWLLVSRVKDPLRVERSARRLLSRAHSDFGEAGPHTGAKTGLHRHA